MDGIYHGLTHKLTFPTIWAWRGSLGNDNSFQTFQLANITFTLVSYNKSGFQNDAYQQHQL